MIATPKYSVVVPIYNDAYLARALCERLLTVFRRMAAGSDTDSEFELIFINDGSEDNSLRELIKLSQEFKFLKVIDLSRNFGQHVAIACGYRHAAGDLIIRMNVDMQDSPSYIPQMVQKLRSSDADIVIGKYSQRQSSALNKFTAYFYYTAFNFLTGIIVPQNTSSLRVMNRRFVDAYNMMQERSPFPQGIDQWLGFNHSYVPLEHCARIDNQSSYTFTSRTKLAINGILYFSDKPLLLIASLGFFVSLIGIVVAGWVILEKVLGTDFLPGYASLLAAVLFASGVNVGFLGIIGLYVGKIFQEVKNRPQYLVRKIYGSEE